MEKYIVNYPEDIYVKNPGHLMIKRGTPIVWFEDVYIDRKSGTSMSIVAQMFPDRFIETKK